MNEITQITPHLFVCGVDAINGPILRKLGITLIINVTNSVAHSLTQENWSVDDEPIINLVQIPVDDWETEVLYPYFEVRVCVCVCYYILLEYFMFLTWFYYLMF